MDIGYPVAQSHTLEHEALSKVLRTDLKNGLAQKEAESRYIRFGPNLYEQKRPPCMFIVFLKQFKSLVVYLLFAGALISFYFRDIPEAISILVVILTNVEILMNLTTIFRNKLTIYSGRN